MNTLALLLTASLLVPTHSPPQLLVRDSSAPDECREAAADGQRAEAMREAMAADVAEDLRRYFGGLSYQATPILDAAWHGQVYFCTRQAEVDVARVLSQLVVKSSDDIPPGKSALPTGAESLLTALASDVLVAELEATPAVTRDEIERKAQALAIVRKNTAASTADEDVVVELDRTPADKVGVHFGHHAAVYYLPRNAPDFEAHLECLRESLADGRRVRFTYTVAGQVITSVQCAEKRDGGTNH